MATHALIVQPFGWVELVEVSLALLVVVEHRMFGAFLVIDDEVDGDASAIGPLWIRRMAAIACSSY
jgi:hypothetical protein